MILPAQLHAGSAVCPILRHRHRDVDGPADMCPGPWPLDRPLQAAPQSFEASPAERTRNAWAGPKIKDVGGSLYQHRLGALA